MPDLKYRLRVNRYLVNPPMKSRGARVGLKISVVPIMLLLSYAAHRGGWHKGEKVIPAIFGVAGGIGVGSSLR